MLRSLHLLLCFAGYCDAPILADTNAQTLEVRDSYYHMAHFSRFAVPQL